ncbi:MAG: para-aminobenzoate synthetase component [Bacteroidales bacterium]|nr:para-aminobenzoate synthetase component [Bacteroidales bacterium]
MDAKFHKHIKNIQLFKQKLCHWGNHFDPFVILDSCEYNQNQSSEKNYYEYDFLAVVKAQKFCCPSAENKFEQVKEFVQNSRKWIFGYFSYDLKNEIELLKSNHLDEVQFPDVQFFIPELVFASINNELFIYDNNQQYTIDALNHIVQQIDAVDLQSMNTINQPVKILSRFDKDEYLETVIQLKNHIQRGDIYEINLCQEFYSHSSLNPLSTWLKLKEASPAPFSCFYKTGNHFLLSASPERFLKKTGNKIISQPIKGTIRRGKSQQEDNFLKDKLFNDPKERAENVMIVDLVRNDLSRTAKKGTVNVEELYGIYSFEQVHQMISTVVSEVETNVSIIDIIKNAFPMGSMTGAPKVRAMELVEQYEKTKRGLYSGAVGYITPDKDFDFNVVIRSILYNQLKNYVSFTVGGAITSLSVPENEYEECMVKAQAMFHVLNNQP